jgi:Xylanase inhibitor N-terminal
LHAHSGTHHVHIYVGSPPQRQTLIVDTGSRVMAFPCKPCKSCGKHASPYFDPLRSTTHRASNCGKCLLEGIATCSLYGEHCEISQKYTEGSSWLAAEVEDMVWLGTSNVLESIEEHMKLAIPYAFGCQTSSNGLFQKQYADGILGLARHESSLVAAYYNAAAIPQNAFSLCLTVDAGQLSLGGSMPTKHHREPMKMTPITRDHGWYSVEVVMLMVGGIEVTSVDNRPSLLDAINSGKGCILDSGTTDTYLPGKLAKAFGGAASAYTDGLTDFSAQFRINRYTFDDFQRLPEVTFVMTNNVTLTMEPRHYMEGVTFDPEGLVKRWKGSKKLTNRIYLEEPEGSVLGANAMFGYDILFDVQRHQIGIAKADCAAAV